ncbi:hypothetical protein [Sneathiella aquimaris]|uniref:hypothetical protein n=1 Tax=Sneathiella aquimaris TaxID=2599305 RepID=UPI00146E5D54|nr:hypothetical protein [Sneathiella aquimaris]
MRTEPIAERLNVPFAKWKIPSVKKVIGAYPLDLDLDERMDLLSLKGVKILFLGVFRR